VFDLILGGELLFLAYKGWTFEFCIARGFDVNLHTKPVSREIASPTYIMNSLSYGVISFSTSRPIQG